MRQGHTTMEADRRGLETCFPTWTQAWAMEGGGGRHDAWRDCRLKLGAPVGAGGGGSQARQHRKRPIARWEGGERAATHKQRARVSLDVVFVIHCTNVHLDGHQSGGLRVIIMPRIELKVAIGPDRYPRSGPVWIGDPTVGSGGPTRAACTAFAVPELCQSASTFRRLPNSSRRLQRCPLSVLSPLAAAMRGARTTEWSRAAGTLSK